jgi:hypothetical protein
MGGGPGKDHELVMNALRGDAASRRWDRGTWIRLALAVAPLVALAILGIFLGH